MKIGIMHRLFLSIVEAASLAILCPLLIVHRSINGGSLQHLNALAIGKAFQPRHVIQA